MVRRLYGDSLDLSNAKKETEYDRSQGSEDERQLWLRRPRHLWLQSLHLQELRLLKPAAGAFGRFDRGAPAGLPSVAAIGPRIY
jgi:hypothetical protein